MASLNQCNFIGNVGRDPEIRYSGDGNAIANFSLAVTEKWNSNGEKKERTEWVRAVAFGRLAEIIGEYVKKGMPLFVTGRQQTRSWEKDGVTRYTTEIVLANMQMLGGKNNADSSGPADQDNEYPPADDDDNCPF